MTPRPGTAPPRVGSKPHLPALDGLRGLAILGVLLFHTDHLPGGFLGVDLFFALSGYLITGLLLREVDRTGTVSLMAFWGRRVRRLFPALAVMLVVVAVVVRLGASPPTVRATFADGPWVQLNLVNWHLLAESASYWDRFGEDRVFEHLWSVAVEEQFYLVWPVVLLCVVRVGAAVDRRVALVAGVGSVVSFALMVVLVDPADPTRVYTGTDTRAFSLLLGAAVATAPVRTAAARVAGRRGAGASMIALTLGMGVAWVLVEGATSSWLFQGGLFVHSAAAALLIGLCVQAPGATMARAFSWRPLRGLGVVSYSLYLWHWPVIALLSPQRTGLDGWGRTAAVFVVSIGVAVLSKVLVEDPIRFRARWARGRLGGLAFVTAMVALAVLWSATPAPAPPTIDVTELR
ncbi:acyltransferase family protein [Patulibacter americanus]|uniref:acyltransferase family protein n=1 Tax=Patulibacter americanus TaxID=588672 RepID=UPI0003B5F4AE|nr:acyltransferase [Patulibacter americanus]